MQFSQNSIILGSGIVSNARSFGQTIRVSIRDNDYQTERIIRDKRITQSKPKIQSYASDRAIGAQGQIFERRNGRIVVA